ncbi:N/A [soil metagenome]
MNSDVTTKIYNYFSTFPVRSYPKGQILIFADSDPEYIFYIISGKVRKYDVSYRGDEVVINIFGKQAFFPMSWAVNRKTDPYFYKTEEETVVHIVPVDIALTFVQEHPDVMFDLLGRVYRGMDGVLAKMAHLMSGSAKSRVLNELITECRRFGVLQPDTSFALNINEGDIAARSGLSRETVSREMQKMKDKSWVKLTGKKILVCDIGALEQAIGKEL